MLFSYDAKSISKLYWGDIKVDVLHVTLIRGRKTRHRSLYFGCNFRIASKQPERILAHFARYFRDFIRETPVVLIEIRLEHLN